MYNRYQLAKKYLHYYFTASNGKGHGIHSPFVFQFINNVLRDKKPYPCFSAIEKVRKELTHSRKIIEVKDFGAGSSVIKSNHRKVGDIARSSLKSRKIAQLLFRMVQYYRPAILLELGTSFGTTSAYLASANPDATLFTCEGANTIAAIARNNFSILGINNIKLIEGDFARTLPILFSTTSNIDFAFLDGNHRKGPTLNYFHELLNHSANSTILVFDDIHWSAEMESAWKEIQQHPKVTLTLDLFYIGVVFLNPDIMVKQDFIIRY